MDKIDNKSTLTSLWENEERKLMYPSVEDSVLPARKQCGKTSLWMKNFLYPKLDTQSLDGFIDKLKNSDKYMEYNREMDRIREVCESEGIE